MKRGDFLELKELCNKTMELFEIADITELGNALMNCVKNNDVQKYSDFQSLVGDLSVDWLQMIFQYYHADRKEKMQDYTPKTLADFMGRLAGNSEIIIDMCAGSGALTIQKWSRNHDSKFLLYEFDENVIPFLLFNMAVRNVSCTVYHADVLQQEIFHTYEISKGERYGVFKEVENGNSFNF